MAQWVDIDCCQPIWIILPGYQLLQGERNKTGDAAPDAFAPPAFCWRAPLLKQ